MARRSASKGRNRWTTFPKGASGEGAFRPGEAGAVLKMLDGRVGKSRTRFPLESRTGIEMGRKP